MEKLMTEINIELIKNMIEDGFAIRRISYITNYHENDIKKIIEENNFSMKSEIFTDDAIPKILELYDQGVSAKNLGQKYGIDKRRIFKWIEKDGMVRTNSESKRFIHFDEHKFDQIDEPTKAYWLGFFYADAYNSLSSNILSVTLKLEDIGHLEKLADFVNYPKNKITHIVNHIEDKPYDSCHIRLSSKHLCNKMVELGCMQAKSFKITFPLWMKEDLYSHFIRGYFDGDGCLTFNKKSGGWKLSIVSTQMFCEKLIDVFNQKINTEVGFRNISQTGNNTCEIDTVGHHKIYNILKYMYANSNDQNRLNRKYNLHIQFMKEYEERHSESAKRTHQVLDSYRQSKIEQDLGNGMSVLDVSEKYKIHSRTVRDIKYGNYAKNKTNFMKVVEINGQGLTASYIKSLSTQEREALVIPTFEYFKNQGWIFPDYNDEELIKSYNNLCELSIDIENIEMNNGNSSFTNICRNFCKSFYLSAIKNKKSLFKGWNDDLILLRTVRNRLSLDTKSEETFTINNRMILQGMNSIGLVPRVSIFKPEIAKYMCLKYSNPGDVVGDYSCGFGARMLGAMSSGRKYIGTDPLTVPELIQMKEFYGFKDCELIQLGSEYYRGEENSVDLYWSSPPYYNQEVYSDDDTQAYNKGKSYFYNEYWPKTLENVKYMLKPEKWFGLNVRNNPEMLTMAEKYFGPIQEIIDLKSKRSHLTGKANEIKYEGIFMFKNQK